MLRGLEPDPITPASTLSSGSDRTHPPLRSDPLTANSHWWAKNPTSVGEAKRRFQRIQEAYTVLSDEGKRLMYDAGLFDPLDDSEEDFGEFMKDFMSAVERVKSEPEKSFEEIQQMFDDLVSGMGMDFGGNGFSGPSESVKQTRANSPRNGTGQCWW